EPTASADAWPAGGAQGLSKAEQKLLFEAVMSSKRRIRCFALGALLSSLLLAIVILVDFDPSLLSAASGWYGYGNAPVVPEASSCTDSFPGIALRNSEVGASCCGDVQYLDGVLRYRADGISVPSPGPSFGVFPTYNNNHENGLGSPSDGNIKLSLGYNWHVGIPQLVDMGGGELRLVGSGSSSVKFQGGSGSSTYNGRLGIDAKVVHDSMAKTMTLYAT